MLKKLLAHSSFYVTGEVIVMAGGLISFPIIARMLGQEEYGVMVLISTTILLVEALSTAGLHHASQRFYSHYEVDAEKIKSFYATLIYGSLAFGIVGTLITMLLFKILSVLGLISGKIQNIFVIALFLVVIRILTNLFGSLYRVREKARTYITFAILRKYLGLALIILFLSVFFWGLTGYYLGLVLGELTVLILYFFTITRNIKFPVKCVSLPMLKQATSYGFPLVFSGLAGTLLISSDRYIIGYFMTKTDVALYSVPYNLCSYLSGILTTGFEFAFIPIVMNEWNKGLNDRVHLEIQRIIRLYCMVAFPLVAGICVLGRQIIILFASDKYVDAHYILPYIMIGIMIQGLLTPLMIGFVFSNSTKQIAVMTWQVAVLNILMNLFLVPKIGLYGAAISTLFCYALLAVVGGVRSSKHFKIEIPWFPIILYGSAALVMGGALWLIGLSFPASMLYTQIVLGTFLYLSLIFVFDKKIRVVTIAHIHTLLKLK